MRAETSESLESAAPEEEDNLAFIGLLPFQAKLADYVGINDSIVIAG